MIRLNKVTRDLNVGIATVVDFLQKKGYTVEANPNTKITDEQYAVLVKEFSKDKDLKIESEKFIQERQNKDRNKASVSIDDIQPKNGKNEVISTVVPEEIRPTRRRTMRRRKWRPTTKEVQRLKRILKRKMKNSCLKKIRRKI